MAIPNFQSIALPLLEFTSDGKEHSRGEAVEAISKVFKLTEEEKTDMLPSGNQVIIDNRIGWAKTYMLKAGLLESPKRGLFKITPLGLDLLKSKPSKIDQKFLERYPLFIEWRKKSAAKKPVEKVEDSEEQTPLENLEDAYQTIKSDLASELIDTIKACSPFFFEQLVVDVIVKMGYGGTRRDAGRATKKTADGGIDGIIKEDRLGLDTIYIQAKKWENPVSQPEIQKFAGALMGVHASKGVFITTSSFTKGAVGFVDKIDSNIVLIDGEMLAELMIEYGIGVSTVANFEIRKIDSDYFTDE